MTAHLTADPIQIEFPTLGDRLLVVYDGYCGLCNRSIRWFLKRDLFDRLRFTPSDSTAVTPILARHGIDALSPSSLIVIENPGNPSERILTRSTGVLAMLSQLPTPWPTCATLLGVVPRPLRDLGYRIVAALRYRLVGRYASCPIPTPEERRHFL